MSTPAQEAALRLALRSLLDDLTYPEAHKGREWTEARLQEPAWTPDQRHWLMRKALQWAHTQGAGVEAALQKAIGEETTLEQTQDDPGDRDADQARPAPLSTTTETLQEDERIAPMATTVNMSTSMQEEVMALYNETELQELHRQAEYMNLAPFNTPPTKHAKAVAAVLAGRVHASDDPVHPWQVAGDRDTPSKRILYMVSKDGCSCPHTEKTNQGRYGCYHAVAVELYERWQQAQHPGLVAAPKTAEERLAGLPPASPKEAPSAPVEPSKPQDVPVVVLPPEPPLEAPSAAETAPVTRATLQLPRRSISAIVADLSKPLPLACIAKLPATEKRPAQDYLHWHTVAAILDAYAPGWEGHITRVERVGERVVRVRGPEGAPGEKTVERIAVTYRLTIHAVEGAFQQEDTGMEDEDKDDYGDTMTSAIATAMKRAAAKFGVGRLQLYDKDDKTLAFLAALRGEKAQALKELAAALDAQEIPREATLAWLKCETGADRTDQLPLWAIRGVLQQLSTAAKVPHE